MSSWHNPGYPNVPTRSLARVWWTLHWLLRPMSAEDFSKRQPGLVFTGQRREEALRRLETTKRNLDRVLDILAELEPRLKSLERQAARCPGIYQSAG